MEKPGKKIPWGELIVPGLALLYASATIIEQYVREFEWKTFLYSVGLGIGVLVTGGICIVQALRRGEQTKTLTEEQEKDRKTGRRFKLVFLAWSALFILSLDFLGYLLTIPIFVIFLFRYLGVKSWPQILLLTTGLLALVHFLFVGWAGLELPLGVLEPLFPPA